MVEYDQVGYSEVSYIVLLCNLIFVCYSLLTSKSWFNNIRRIAVQHKIKHCYLFYDRILGLRSTTGLFV